MWWKKVKSLFRGKDSNISETLLYGTVKFFNRKKGFGFIQAEESAKEIFVHASDLKDRINKGDNVKFELASTQKGIKAINVHRLEKK